MMSTPQRSTGAAFGVPISCLGQIGTFAPALPAGDEPKLWEFLLFFLLMVDEDKLGRTLSLKM